MFVVLGSTGYVGSVIVFFLKKMGQHYVGLNRTDIDYSNASVLKEFLRFKNQDFD